ncbi:MAG: hypothetical protein FJ008_07655 [Chloroflexi bacterium]|nr:hypothetical protein [Chloroflexota bacterium]MBM3155192.1 hypothetical protein [Chloroflexota bacterium]MBM3173360.1 hypothetical protein [Chloroflexota bacterium]MBM3175600.1 hypothetical protein [Chloroflexota bacterium]MBM4450768.1 hypothetical protein [Chloroflexota bacterium]
MPSENARSVKIRTSDGNVVVELYSVKRDGDKLVMDAKVLDAMRMDMVVAPDEVSRATRLLLPAVIRYVLFLPCLALKRLLRKPDK